MNGENGQRLLGYIESHPFREAWPTYGLTEDDFAELENMIRRQPEAGRVIRGAGGLRKLRMAAAGRGKSGGYRVLYAIFERHGLVLLVDVYAKNEQEDISPEGCRRAAELLRHQKATLEAGRYW